MSPKSKPKASLTSAAFNEIKRLPGNVRRLLISAIDDLEVNPRPHNSKQLILAEESREIRRLRIDKWRIIYFIEDNHPIIIGIRHRPPYDYSDLQNLVKNIEG